MERLVASFMVGLSNYSSVDYGAGERCLLRNTWAGITIAKATTIIIANASATSRIPPGHPRTAPKRFVPRPLKNQPPKIVKMTSNHAVSHPYCHGFAEDEHMIKNDKDQHNSGEKETGPPRNAVAKNT